MIFHKAIRWATFLLPVFLVVFAVLIGAAWFAGSVGDGGAGRWMANLALISGLAFLVDLILLVWMLGLTSVMMTQRRLHGRRKGMMHRERQRMRRLQEEDCERRRRKRHKKRRRREGRKEGRKEGRHEG